MKIGVYVGSFDPVHKGHKKIVDHLINNHYVDKVIIIPTGNYWDKKQFASIIDRINMLKTYASNKIIINEKLNNYPYTYQILDELKKEHPSSTLYLIIGADTLEKFDKWKNVQEILKNKVIVLPRNNIDTIKYINKYKEKNNFTIIEDFDNIDMSSTFIRNNIKNKLDVYLDKKVIDYIKQHNLYMGVTNDKY